MSRQPSRNGVLLPLRNFDDQQVAIVSPRDLAVAQLEDRLSQQERTTRSLIEHAFRVKDDVIASLNTARGTWQSEAESRELLQEHIRAITDVVRKLGRDIQVVSLVVFERVEMITVDTVHIILDGCYRESVNYYHD